MTKQQITEYRLGALEIAASVPQSQSWKVAKELTQEAVDLLNKGKEVGAYVAIAASIILRRRMERTLTGQEASSP